jgi:SAM-dependent methyltransferase
MPQPGTDFKKIRYISELLTFAQIKFMDLRSQQDWFSSSFYHQFYNGQSADTQNFILQLINRLDVKPGNRLLHLACGTGEYSEALVSRGYDVSGIDISPLNIAEAKKKENSLLQFFIHDIRLPFWGNYFDYALSLFSGFGHYNTRREHDAAVRTIANSLKPGGTLVIDYPNVHYVEDHEIKSEEKTFGSTSYDIHNWNDSLNFYKKIKITDPSLPAGLEFIETTAKFSLGDFTDMLSFQGLQVQEVYGGYQLQPYDIRKTPRLLILASKGSLAAGDKEKRLYSDGRKTDALT